MFCNKCGVQSSDGVEFCTGCGAKMGVGTGATSLQYRSPVMLVILTIVTFGLYGLYWEIVTKGELNDSGADIPTAWLIIIPIANILWMWKFCEGVEQVSGGKMNGAMAFLLIFFLSIIGGAIIQDTLNKVAE